MADPRDLIQRLADKMARCEVDHRLLDEAYAYLATSEPAAGLTDEELWNLYHDQGRDFSPTEYARAVLARWSHQPPQPISLSERLPGPEDCDAEGRCWMGSRLVNSRWNLETLNEGICFHTHWLPHHALPLPEVDNG